MALQPASNKQIPDHSILDYFNKQTYLGNGFSLPVSGIAIAGTSETTVALISNPSVAGAPSGSAKALFLSLRRVSSTANYLQMKFYISPTVTSNGTAATPVNLRPANATTSVSACYTAPTVSAKGTLIDTLETPSSYYISQDAYRLIILDPGQSLLMTCTAAGATTLNLNVGWYEL